MVGRLRLRFQMEGLLGNGYELRGADLARFAVRNRPRPRPRPRRRCHAIDFEDEDKYDD